MYMWSVSIMTSSFEHDAQLRNLIAHIFAEELPSADNSALLTTSHAGTKGFLNNALLKMANAGIKGSPFSSTQMHYTRKWLHDGSMVGINDHKLGHVDHAVGDGCSCVGQEAL